MLLKYENMTTNENHIKKSSTTSFFIRAGWNFLKLSFDDILIKNKIAPFYFFF